LTLNALIELWDPGDITSSWGYRLICIFSLDGKEYKVTPEPSTLVSFNSKQQVEKYLNEKIDQNGYCKLWVKKIRYKLYFIKKDGGCNFIDQFICRYNVRHKNLLTIHSTGFCKQRKTSEFRVMLFNRKLTDKVSDHK
jgi:hypothetical protein